MKFNIFYAICLISLIYACEKPEAGSDILTKVLDLPETSYNYSNIELPPGVHQASSFNSFTFKVRILENCSIQTSTLNIPYLMSESSIISFCNFLFSISILYVITDETLITINKINKMMFLRVPFFTLVYFVKLTFVM